MGCGGSVPEQPTPTELTKQAEPDTILASLSNKDEVHI